MRPHLFFIPFLLLTKAAICQDNPSFHSIADTLVLILPEQLIPSSKELYSNENVNISIEDVLRHTGSAMISTSGPSHLTSISFRGLSSRQSAILWNETTLNSSTNGIVDYKLIPQIYFSNSSLLSNSPKSSFGNNTLGGGIYLNEASTEKGKILLQYGQGDNFTIAGIANLKYHKINLKFGIQWQDDKNNYQYYSNSKLHKTYGNFLKGTHVNGDLYYNANPDIQLHVSAWIQNSNRAIRTYLPDGRLQYQHDQNNRFSLAFKYAKGIVFAQNTSSLLRENLDFTDIGINSISNVTTLQNKTKLMVIGPLKKQIEFAYKNEKASPNYYDKTQKRTEIYLKSLLEFAFQKKHKISTSITPRWIDWKFGPITYGIEYALEDSIVSYEIQFGKYYQLPNLNDLYWPLGGDTNLKPETSYQFNLNLHYNPTPRHSIEAAVFSYQISNYIQWAPWTTSLWKAYNRKSVWNRGFELNYKSTLNLLPHINNNITLSYNYVKATTFKDDFNTNYIGKQLPYVPLHKVAMNMEFSVKNLSWSLQPIFVSKRYETLDNSSSLSSFLILDGYVSYGIKNSIFKLSLTNIGSSQYEYFKAFPQPTRQYQIIFIQKII